MIRIRQPEALALVQEHFKPLLFAAVMDSSRTIQCMVMNEHTGDSLVLSGLPCEVTLSISQLAELITLIELDIAALRPSLLQHLNGRLAPDRSFRKVI